MEREPHDSGGGVAISRVCVLFHFPRCDGGAELHTLQLAAQLAARGSDVVLAVPAEIRQQIVERAHDNGVSLSNVELVSIQLRELRGLLGAMKVLRSLAADVVVFPKGGYRAGTLWFEAATSLLKIPLVTIEHCTPPEFDLAGRCGKYGVWRTKLRWLGWSRSICPKQIVVVSERTAISFRETLGYCDAKIIAVPNGVDADLFRGDAALRCDVRGEWEISRTATVFGMCARLVPNKRVDAAISAVARISDERKPTDMHLVICGDGPERAKLEAMIDSLQLRDVIHLKGFVSEPWRVYPGFDFQVVASEREGLPLSMLEAMAAGCIPVATPVGGIPDVVKPGVNGILAESVVAESLYEAMVQAVETDPETRSHLSENAVATVRSQHDIRVQMDKLCVVVEDAAG